IAQIHNQLTRAQAQKQIAQERTRLALFLGTTRQYTGKTLAVLFTPYSEWADRYFLPWADGPRPPLALDAATEDRQNAEGRQVDRAEPIEARASETTEEEETPEAPEWLPEKGQKLFSLLRRWLGHLSPATSALLVVLAILGAGAFGAAA